MSSILLLDSNAERPKMTFERAGKGDTEVIKLSKLSYALVTSVLVILIGGVGTAGNWVTSSIWQQKVAHENHEQRITNNEKSLEELRQRVDTKLERILERLK